MFFVADFHRKALFLSIGGVLGLLVILNLIGNYQYQQQFEAKETQYTAYQTHAEEQLAQLSTLYADERLLYPKDSTTEEVIDTYRQQFNEWDQLVGSFFSTRIAGDDVWMESLSKEKEAIDARLLDIEGRVIARDAINTLFEAPPFENAEVMAYPSVREALTIEDVEAVREKIGVSSDAFYAEVQELRNLAWNQMQLLEEIQSEMSTYQTAASVSDVNLEKVQMTLAKINNLTNSRVKSKLYANLSPFIARILDLQFMRFVNVSANGDVSLRSSITLTDDTAYILNELIESLNDLNQQTKYRAMFDLIATEAQQTALRQEAEQEARRVDQYRDAAERGLVYDPATRQMVADASFIDVLIRGESAIEEEEEEDDSSDIMTGVDSTETAAQVLARYQSYAWFQDASGVIYYQAPGVTEPVVFDLNEVAYVKDGVSYWYHPVAKVLYTVDATGQAVPYTGD